MTYRSLLGFGAFMAVAGGALRIISAYIPYVDGLVWLEFLYAVIDLLLLTGLVASYLSVALQLGWLGLITVFSAATGFASIVGPDPVRWGVDFYMLGAAVIAVSLAVLAVQLLWLGTMKQAALYWLAALASGLLSLLASSPFAFSVAGMLLGLGFVAAGLDTAACRETVSDE